MKRLERLVAMALFLGARRRVLAREVAEQFEVSLRTVYRDIKALANAGFPVEGNAGDGYRLLQESYLRPLALSGDEAEVLAIAAWRSTDERYVPRAGLSFAEVVARDRHLAESLFGS